MQVNADLSKILKKEHEEKWVALSEDHAHVVDFDISLMELTKRLDTKKNHYVYMKVLRSDMEYSFPLSWRSD